VKATVGARFVKPLNVFKVDKEFTRLLHKRLANWDIDYFRRRRPKSFHPIPIPSLAQLEQIILTLFGASILQEEGRFSQFRVEFGEPFPDPKFSITFLEPKPWSTEELRKVGPAVPPPNGCLGIWPVGKDLRIWGIQILTLVRLRFEILGPGRITVSVPLDNKIAEITPLKSGFISSQWQTSVQGVYRYVDSTPDRNRANPALAILPSMFVKEILTRMRLVKHGGAIIVVPKKCDWRKHVELPIFYDCLFPFGQMKRVADWIKEKSMEIEQRSAEGSREKLEESMKLLVDYGIKTFLSDAARSIAYLATVDGALLINSDFEVLSFGTKLKSKKRSEDLMIARIRPLEAESNPEEIPLSEECRGMRHLSAALFIAANPGAVAFVVSQDGGISCFVKKPRDESNTESSLTVYRGVELVV
jgi:sensor domain DACNV-containing protein